MPPTADSPPPPRRLLVVTIDRLPAWILSAWGSTWVAAPALDALAARGVVFDRVLAPTLDPLAIARGLLGHAAASIPAVAAATGRRVAVVTDQPAVVEAVDVGDQADVTIVEAACPRDEAADEGATNLGRLFAAATRVLVTGQPDVMWVHAGSLGIAWDAPAALRQQYLDPDDPSPPPGAAVPNMAVAPTTDPDLLVSLRHVFAAQVTLLDRGIGRLVEAAGADWTMLVAGLRGMPLGLHDWMGAAGLESGGRLPYGESIHLPAIMVDAAGRMRGQRYGGLVIPADLGSTIAAAVGVACRATGGEPGEGRSVGGLFAGWQHAARDRVVVRAAAGDALVTNGWHLIDTGADATPRRLMLFAKPDDFFERNDVADRCRSVAEELAGVLGRGSAMPSTSWHQPLSPSALTGA